MVDGGRLEMEIGQSPEGAEKRLARRGRGNGGWLGNESGGCSRPSRG